MRQRAIVLEHAADGGLLVEPENIAEGMTTAAVDVGQRVTLDGMRVVAQGDIVASGPVGRVLWALSADTVCVDVAGEQRLVAARQLSLRAGDTVQLNEGRTHALRKLGQVTHAWKPRPSSVINEASPEWRRIRDHFIAPICDGAVARPRGILLHGPAGTGKSTLANALASALPSTLTFGRIHGAQLDHDFVATIHGLYATHDVVFFEHLEAAQLPPQAYDFIAATLRAGNAITIVESDAPYATRLYQPGCVDLHINLGVELTHDRIVRIVDMFVIRYYGGFMPDIGMQIADALAPHAQLRNGAAIERVVRYLYLAKSNSDMTLRAAIAETLALFGTELKP